jgi:hypothetical protein
MAVRKDQRVKLAREMRLKIILPHKTQSPGVRSGEKFLMVLRIEAGSTKLGEGQLSVESEQSEVARVLYILNDTQMCARAHLESASPAQKACEDGVG